MASAGPLRRFFSYDATSQLTDADHSYQTDEAYEYDENGNRTSTGYQTGTNNRLLSDGTYAYEYDDEGTARNGRRSPRAITSSTSGTIATGSSPSSSARQRTR